MLVFSWVGGGLKSPGRELSKFLHGLSLNYRDRGRQDKNASQALGTFWQICDMVYP